MQGYIVLGPVCSMSEFVASLSLNQDDVTLSKAADSALEFCKEGKTESYVYCNCCKILFANILFYKQPRRLN